MDKVQVPSRSFGDIHSEGVGKSQDAVTVQQPRCSYQRFVIRAQLTSSPDQELLDIPLKASASHQNAF